MIPDALTVEAGTKASKVQLPGDNEDEAIIQLDQPSQQNTPLRSQTDTSR